MWFSYYKTANYTALCGLVRCGATMSFCGRFWCGFCGLCGLCGLVNTPCATSSMMSLHSLYILFISYSLKIQSLKVGISDVKLCVAW